MKDLNDAFENNLPKIEEIAKRVLIERWREGVNSYFFYLHNKAEVPTNWNTNCYYFMCNLKKPNSEINYIPVGFRSTTDEEQENLILTYRTEDDLENELMLRIDLEDERLVDFLLNNEQNDKWIMIYEILHQKKVKLDLFEEIIFDYVFNQGFSIRHIAKITGNSMSWCYRYRKSVIEKIKRAIDDGKNL